MSSTVTGTNSTTTELSSPSSFAQTAYKWGHRFVTGLLFVVLSGIAAIAVLHFGYPNLNPTILDYLALSVGSAAILVIPCLFLSSYFKEKIASLCV